jgi:hypothetical protein|tara:strand:- start:3558 stop:3890 length:333 start_codon:yes stop_codon:yes gene_type:complete
MSKKKNKTITKSQRAKRWAKTANVDLILDGSGYEPKGVKKWAETSWGRFGRTRDVLIYEKINGKTKLVGFREFGDDASKDGFGKGQSPSTQRKLYLNKKGRKKNANKKRK